jgi:hypothetical protein
MPYSASRGRFGDGRAPSLDGWWIARAASLGGVRLPSEALPGLAILLFNRTLYLGSDTGIIDIDYGVRPASMDLLITRGPNRWRFIPAVFQHHDQILRLCFDLSGASRPTAFESPFGSRILVIEYARAPLREVQPGPGDIARDVDEGGYDTRSRAQRRRSRGHAA